MIERQSARPIGVKLRRDFAADLTPERRVQRNLRTIAGQIAAESTAAIDKTRNVGTVS